MAGLARLLYPPSFQACCLSLAAFTQPTGNKRLATEFRNESRRPPGCCCFSFKCRRFICRVALTRDSFNPPKRRQVDFYREEGLYQVVHGRAVGSTFDYSSSSGVVVYKQEDSPVVQLPFSLPSHWHHGQELYLADQVVPYKVFPQHKELTLDLVLNHKPSTARLIQ